MNIPGSVNSQCKGPEVGMCLQCWGTARKPGWLKHSEGGGEGRRWRHRGIKGVNSVRP